MNTRTKLLTILSLLVLTALVFPTTALAFDGRSGDRIVISAGEVINDDLYLSAREVIVDGTINGDLMAAGEIVVVNGTVTGDLWAAGNSVTVNGEVGDDVFAAAAAVTLGRDAKVTDDVFGGAASVESMPGSQIGGTLLIGAFQGLVSGSVAEDLLVGASRLRLEGSIGGDAMIAVDNAENTYAPNPMMYNPNMPAMPSVPSGLTFGDEASIAGLLKYTTPIAISIPASVTTQVQHEFPPTDAQIRKEISQRDGITSRWLDELRRLVALLLVGLLIARLIPAWIVNPASKIQARPLPSLGVGFLGLVVAPFILLAGLAAVIMVAVLMGALTLGELVGMVLGIGLPVLALVGILFVLALGYLPQAAVAYIGGRWILNRVRPEAAGNIYWTLLVGLVVLGILMALPVLGGLIEFFVVILGLGAIALLIWERRQPTAATVASA
jgi:cytoskeletal protein CcmA (bactofilin family)